MADPVAILQKIFTVAKTIKALYDTVKENRKRFKNLVLRLDAIVEVLQEDVHRKAILGNTRASVALGNMLSTIEAVEKFLRKYQGKTTISKIVFSNSIREDFEDLNDELTIRVNDLNLLLSSQTASIIAGGQALSPIQNPNADGNESNTKDLDDEAVEIFCDDKHTQLLVWLSMSNKETATLFKRAAARNSNVLLVNMTTIEDFETFWLTYRELTAEADRIRVIASGSFCEQAIRILYNRRFNDVSVMVYTSDQSLAERQAVIESKWPEKFKSRGIMLNKAPEAIVKFASFSLVAWANYRVSEENNNLVNSICDLGIKVSTFSNSNEFKSWLERQPWLLAAPQFRVVTGRAYQVEPGKFNDLGYKEAIQYLHTFAKNDSGDTNNAPLVMAYVGNTAGFESFPRFKVTGSTDEATKFMSMEPQMWAHDPKVSQPAPKNSPILSHSKSNAAAAPAIAVAPVAAAAAAAALAPQATKYHTLTITKISCTNLAPKDTNGKSDPYVQIFLNAKHTPEHTTPRISRNLNPVWVIKPGVLSLKLSEVQKLRFDVWDHDTYTGHDFEGQAFWELRTVPTGSSQTFTLKQRPNKSETVTGTITIEFKLD